ENVQQIPMLIVGRETDAVHCGCWWILRPADPNSDHPQANRGRGKTLDERHWDTPSEPANEYPSHRVGILPSSQQTSNGRRINRFSRYNTLKTQRIVAAITVTRSE